MASEGVAARARCAASWPARRACPEAKFAAMKRVNIKILWYKVAEDALGRSPKNHPVRPREWEWPGRNLCYIAHTNLLFPTGLFVLGCHCFPHRSK